MQQYNPNRPTGFEYVEGVVDYPDFKMANLHLTNVERLDQYLDYIGKEYVNVDLELFNQLNKIDELTGKNAYSVLNDVGYYQGNGWEDEVHRIYEQDGISYELIDAINDYQRASSRYHLVRKTLYAGHKHREEVDNREKELDRIGREINRLNRTPNYDPEISRQRNELHRKADWHTRANNRF